MSEKVSSSSEVINPGLDGEPGLSNGRMQEKELLDLLVVAKGEVLRSQGLAVESRQLLLRDPIQRPSANLINLGCYSVCLLVNGGECHWQT
ncbi:hypothetical protein MLD38_007283 [Melastoma candidum]|uniref:Uncharacterized protein n=1 Tax=Melastoma candidum TaxID=119954 RepID=A0ACB9RPW1_9MYRT|nr:hypothetical protein MLD38_007283 [Melastoma candidum]